jgi:hypothetical protein
VPSGAPGPELEPHFFAGTIWFAATARGTTIECLVRDATIHPPVKLIRLAPSGSSIQFFRNRDFCLTQHMLHLRFAQP